MVFFSHPTHFTPVCNTELSGFAQRQKEFTAPNTKLIGLSINSIHANVARVHHVKKNMAILMDVPIIADIDMSA